MKFRAIGFDWGGVISQIPGPSFGTAAAMFLGIEKEEFQTAYFHHNHLVNKGPESTSYEEAVEMWEAILLELDKGDALNNFLEFVRSRPKAIVNEEMLELVQLLRHKGWKLGLFSNNSVEVAEEFRQHGYNQLFDVALFSGEVNCMKPEPEAFMMLATALGISVRELVFIDDSERSLSTAREVGYTPLLFTDRATLIDQLESLGISVLKNS